MRVLTLRSMIRSTTVVAALLLAPLVAAAAGPTFRLTVPPGPLHLVVYGDMRFTDPRDTVHSDPAARRALVARIAAARPLALFMDGDLPFRGGDVADYAEYRRETAAWRRLGIHEYPVMGNHEYAGCAPQQCRDNWWQAFPALKGRRWYSVQLGSQLYAIGLDSNGDLKPGSAQYRWFTQQLAAIPADVPFVLVWLHHPPVADAERGAMPGHCPRPNEQVIARLLDTVAPNSPHRFLVVSGHVHNYERFAQDGVSYIVSGGGGASPDRVARTAADFYPGGHAPNYHYLALTVTPQVLQLRMRRYTPGPHGTVAWVTADHLTLLAHHP